MGIVALSMQAACMTLSPYTKANLDDISSEKGREINFNGVSLLNLGPLWIFASANYNPGNVAIRDRDFASAVNYSSEGVSVDVLLPSGDADRLITVASQKFWEEVAHGVSEAYSAVTFITGLRVPVRQIRIALLPKDRAEYSVDWSQRSYSFVGPRNFHLSLVDTFYPGDESWTIRSVARLAAHELTHVAVAVQNRGKKLPFEESEGVAASMESCVELKVFGSTRIPAPDVTSHAAIEVEATGQKGRQFAAIIGDRREAGFGNAQERSELFGADGIITEQDSKRAARLMELCHRRIAAARL